MYVYVRISFVIYIREGPVRLTIYISYNQGSRRSRPARLDATVLSCLDVGRLAIMDDRFPAHTADTDLLRASIIKIASLALSTCNFHHFFARYLQHVLSNHISRHPHGQLSQSVDDPLPPSLAPRLTSPASSFPLSCP